MRHQHDTPTGFQPREQENPYIITSGDISRRRTRAYALLAKGDTPVALDAETFFVPSQSSSKRYKVTRLNGWTCECPDHQTRNVECKHIQATRLFLKLRDSQEDDVLSLLEETTRSEDECPSCHSHDLIKRGIRQTTQGEKQRYSCKGCSTRFVLTPIKGIKTTAKMVCLAMDCYYKGLSYRDIADQFQQFYGIKLHHETIRRWVLRFTQAIEKHTRQAQPKTTGTWNADETLIRTKKAKMDYEYVWNVMDNETKFLLASVNSTKGRGTKDAERVMREAQRQNGANPAEIITDRLPSYQDGIRRTFRNWGVHRTVKHTSILGQRRTVNNNAIENHHTHQKEFHKVRRGVNEVQAYQDGFKVYHNYVRKATTDGKTPAQRCGIGVTGNRWEALLLSSLKVPNATQTAMEVKSPAD